MAKKKKQVIPKVSKENSKDLLLEITRLNKTINRRVKQNKLRYIWIRSFVSGLFSTVGASIGFVLLIIASTKIIQQASEIPILDVILEKTNISQIIEYQIKQIEDDSTQESE